MQAFWEDRLIIADLMTGWMHRDLAEWDKMLELFHTDGTIEVTWFEGLFTDFVKGSQRMGGSALVTKHLISSPMIEFHGDKAIAETNAMIVIENAQMRLGATVHNRFYDWVENVTVYGKLPAVRQFTILVRLISLKELSTSILPVLTNIRLPTRRLPIYLRKAVFR